MSNPSRLEIFPDEIFLDLFSYISPIELYHVWNGLNSRLSAILRSVPVSFDLLENTEKYIQALNYFSLQIVYIRVYVSDHGFDLQQFPKLRSLVIDGKLTMLQLEKIQPTILPHLERLTFSERRKSNELFHESIFTNEQNVPWIKVYHLPSIPDYFLSQPSKLFHIQTMIFDRVTPYDIDHILSLQKSLRRLKVTVAHWLSDDRQTALLTTDGSDQHKHLIHLDITLNTCSKLHCLYRLLPRLVSLRYLYIACDSLIMTDFEQLACELNARVPWLKSFRCSFKQTRIDHIEKIHSMSPLFRHMQCQKVQWKGGWSYYCVTTEKI